MANSIEVSEEFYNIYCNFNVSSQVEKMKQLDKKELYLLLLVVLDNFDEEDPVFLSNIKADFKDEMMEIYEVMDDKPTDNEYLNELISEIDNKYIEYDKVLFNGKKLPKPKTVSEVRDAKINLLNK